MEYTKLVKLYRTLGNERRLKIIQLCQTPRNVTQISEILNIPLTRTSEYLAQLQKQNLISKEKSLNNSIIVTSLIEINNNGELRIKQ